MKIERAPPPAGGPPSRSPCRTTSRPASIIAIATSLGFWQAEFGISNFAVGLLAALSANAFGAAIGAAIGGPLCDRFGRKAIYTYDLLVYMAGVLLAAFAMNFTMLLAAFIITGIAVGAGRARLLDLYRRAGTCRVSAPNTSAPPSSPGRSAPFIGFAARRQCWHRWNCSDRGIIFVHLFVVAAIV